jgi:hypothetical protein
MVFMDFKYTMDDVAVYIDSYSRSLELEMETTNFSDISNDIYERNYLKYNKVLLFKKLYYRALTSSKNEQELFVHKMAPILDDFYGEKKYANKTK